MAALAITNLFFGFWGLLFWRTVGCNEKNVGLKISGKEPAGLLLHILPKVLSQKPIWKIKN